MTPTSKFIAVEYHCLFSHLYSVNNVSKPISIDKIDGKVNSADIFTKSKGKESEFLAVRKLLWGW